MRRRIPLFKHKAGAGKNAKVQALRPEDETLKNW
jgi:hypothetical protein